MLTIDEAEKWLRSEVIAWPESVAIANAAYPPPEGWLWMGEAGDVLLVCRPSSSASAAAQAAWGEANALGREAWAFKESKMSGERMDGWFWVRTCKENEYEAAHFERGRWSVIADEDSRSESEMYEVGPRVIDLPMQQALIHALDAMVSAYVMEAEEGGGYEQRPAYLQAKALLEWAEGNNFR